jgi:hypothetical protein
VEGCKAWWRGEEWTPKSSFDDKCDAAVDLEGFMISCLPDSYQSSGIIYETKENSVQFSIAGEDKRSEFDMGICYFEL